MLRDRPAGRWETMYAVQNHLGYSVRLRRDPKLWLRLNCAEFSMRTDVLHRSLDHSTNFLSSSFHRLPLDSDIVKTKRSAVMERPTVKAPSKRSPLLGRKTE